jgi:arabinofuranosyltransferase
MITPGKLRFSTTLLLLLAFIIALLVPVMFGDAPQDDAYISYIYSRNFARGFGLVYNPGEAPVEGYTNYLWTVAIGWGMRFGMNPEAVVPWVGLALTLITVPATFVLALRLGSSQWFAALAALLFATRPVLAVHAMGGMETPLFGLLIVLGILPRLREPEHSGLREDWTSAGFLSLAALTRPEGILIYGLLELAELFGVRRSGIAGLTAAFRRGLLRALPFVLIVGCHLAWRYHTYGDWVPNTFHAKVSTELSVWADGLWYVLKGLIFFGPIFILLPYFTGPSEAKLRRNRFLCLWISSAFLAYVVYVGGDYIPSFRFLWPIMPLWCALAAASTTSLVTAAAGPVRRSSSWTASLLFLVLLVAHTSWEYLGSYRWESMHERHSQLVEAGRKLNSFMPEAAWMAVTNAGRLPYFADRRTLDMMGLSDAHIARVQMADSPELAGHLKGDGGYVLDRAPEFILFLRIVLSHEPLANNPQWLAVASNRAFGISEKQITQDVRFSEQYKLLSIPLESSGVWLNVFVRDGAIHSEIPPGAILTAAGDFEA